MAMLQTLLRLGQRNADCAGHGNDYVLQLISMTSRNYKSTWMIMAGYGQENRV